MRVDSEFWEMLLTWESFLLYVQSRLRFSLFFGIFLRCISVKYSLLYFCFLELTKRRPGCIIRTQNRDYWRLPQESLHGSSVYVGKSQREQGSWEGLCGTAVVLPACLWGHQETLTQLNTLGLHQWLNCIPLPLDGKKKGWKVLAEQGAGNHRPRKEAIDHISLFIYENKVLSKTKESLFKIDRHDLWWYEFFFQLGFITS